MNAFELAELIERVASLGILLVAGVLASLSLVAWRRERRSRMAVVAVAYGLFALYGLFVFLERPIGRALGGGTAEVLEHGGSVFVLLGMLAFFVAIVRD